jgi:hypothetical protein
MELLNKNGFSRWLTLTGGKLKSKAAFYSPRV